MGRCLSSGGFQAVPGRRGARCSFRLARHTALAAMIAVGHIGPIRAQDVLTDGTLPSRGSVEPPARLPQVTVYSKRKRIAIPKPAKPSVIVAPAAPTPKLANAPALPDGVALNGGPPVTQTTAGPVSGYRALTSGSATKIDTPIERIPQAVVVVSRAVFDAQQ